MIVSDFLNQLENDIQDKSTNNNKHWSIESLLLKLQDAYIDMQFDLPFFIAIKDIEIKKGQNEYYIDNVFLKDIFLLIDNRKWRYTDIDNLYLDTNSYLYSYYDKKIMLNRVPQKDNFGKLSYKYEKKLSNINCHIELPNNFKKGLEYLTKAYVYEKPIRNTKERDLNKHYLNLYKAEVYKLQNQKKIIAKNLTSKYQII